MRKYLAVAAVMTCAFAAPAVAEDLEFLLVNNSSSALTGFYVSAASSEHWEENLLEGRILASGYEVTVTIADGLSTCIYDLRGVFQDGDVLEDLSLDLCELGEYTFTD
jgi:hypothetical protein